MLPGKSGLHELLSVVQLYKAIGSKRKYATKPWDYQLVISNRYMDIAYISALSALAGSAIGGLPAGITTC
jgi:hypothetical protein